MKQIQTLDRQNIIDAHIIASGTLDGIMQSCALSGICLTDSLTEGTLVCIDDSAAVTRNVNAYALRGLSPATDIAPGNAKLAASGIGSMAVETEFIVK